MRFFVFCFFVFANMLEASGSHIHLLAGSSKIKNSEETFVFGSGLDLVRSFRSGLELGVGSEILYSNNKDYNTNVAYDLSLLFGYDFEKKYSTPLALRMGVGYAWSTIDNLYTQKGFVSQIGMEYSLLKSLGLGVKYKTHHLDINTQNMLLYLYFKK